MSVVEWVRELGGVARRGALLKLVDRAELETALASGEIVRDARGCYALPETDVAVRAAHQLGGVVSLTSAALSHGWGVKTVPAKPHVVVSRGRRISRKQRQLAHVHRGELSAHQVAGWVTSVEVTLEQCLRKLPFDEALCIADSALREGVGALALQGITDRAVGPGSRQVRRVASEASPLAANPFESVLRAIAIDVPGLTVRPQVAIVDCDVTVRPDLVDERLRIVLEADSFEWHGGRSALAADARRYNMLVVGGWIVLRFSYEDVMFHAEDVRRVLVAAVALAELLTQRGPGWRPAA